MIVQAVLAVLFHVLLPRLIPVRLASLFRVQLEVQILLAAVLHRLFVLVTQVLALHLLFAVVAQVAVAAQVVQVVLSGPVAAQVA